MQTSVSDSRGRAKVGDLMSLSVTDDQVPISFLSPPWMRVLLTSFMYLSLSFIPLIKATDFDSVFDLISQGNQGPF